jgi:hypothetical protein
MIIPWALLQMMASKDRLKIQCVLFQMMAFKRPIEDSMCFLLQIMSFQTI